MTTRTFIQQGRGYGSDPVSVVASLDGNQIFSGTIPTLDQPVPNLPFDFDSFSGANLFTWTTELEFQGTMAYQITVTGGTLILGYTVANYTGNNEAPSPEFDVGEPGTAENYGYFYASGGLSPDPAEVPPLIWDPMTEVTINGVSRTQYRTSDEDVGQFFWTLPAGSIFAATLNINAGWVAGTTPPVRPYPSEHDA